MNDLSPEQLPRPDSQNPPNSPTAVTGGEQSADLRRARGWRRIFVGPCGLRAGWRLAIFFAMVAVAMVAIIWLLNPRKLVALYSGAAGTLLIEVISFAVALLAGLVMTRIERRSLADYGLPARGAFGVRVWEGVLWGFALQTVELSILHATGNFDFGSLALHGRSALHFAFLWGAAFLMVGLYEEFMFRGYSLSTLTTGMGFWPAAFLLSALFGLVHRFNPGETWMGSLGAGLAGLVLCVGLRRTGSLWFPIGLHAGWDWAETFFYGVPDSGMVAPGHLLNSSFHGSRWMTGGTAGPEGSVIAIVVELLVIGLLVLRFPQAKFPRSASLTRMPGPEPAISNLPVAQSSSSMESAPGSGLAR